MKSVLAKISALLLSAFIVVGCGHEGGSSTAIMDLSVIANATGQDEVILASSEEARAELGAQLQQLAMSMDQQIAAQQAEMGANPTPEQQAQLQQMTMQARQQLGEAQSQAQVQANQIEESLINEFRKEIQPLVEEIAASKGASIVLLQDASIFWSQDSLDITDEVIAAWKALPQDSEGEAEEMAEELEEVEEELAETEEELAEAEEQLEELQEELEEAEAVITE